MNDVESVLEERNAKYGNSWITANYAVLALVEGDASRLQGLMDSGHMANFQIIANKLARAITDYDNPDTWRDIAGYANLSLALALGEEDKYLPLGRVEGPPNKLLSETRLGETLAKF